MTEEELDALAEAILDGRPIDWDALNRTVGAKHRQRVARLRILAAMVAAPVRSDDAADASVSEPEPVQWDEYALIEPIGHGLSGEVWRAHDPHLDRDIALKIIPAADQAEATAVLQEGRLLARIRHPNVATVFGATLGDGEVGVAMEFVPGEDLEEHVRGRGPLPPGEVLDIGIQLARALDAVHKAGLLHRDVKAANAKRFPDGRVVLLDFGSGRELHTQNGEPVEECGTPLYLAPEVLQGSPATVQSDLYGLGVLLFRLLTGRHPVEAASIDALRAAHAQGGSGHLAVRGVPRRLARFIDAALDPSQAKRPSSAERAAAMLAGGSARLWWVAAVLIAASLGGTLWSVRHFATGRVGRGHDPLRRIEWPVAPSVMGTPSRDGRLLPFSQRTDGSLSVLDLDSGKARQLSTPAELLGGHALSSAASRDGSRIAFTWYVHDCGCAELRTIDVQSGRQSSLWRWAPGVDPFVFDWSPDGRSLAVTARNADRTTELVTITPPAAPRVIGRGYLSRPSFSDDNRYLVFHEAEVLNGSAHLSVFDQQRGASLPVLADRFDDRNPVWLGDTLLFESNRGGEAALWAVNFDGARGAVSGGPRLIRQGLGGISPLATTSDGSLFYARGEGSTGVSVATLDGAQPPQRVSHFDGGASPDWSPDGNRLAWIEEPASSPLRHILRIRDLRTDRETEFAGLGRDFRSHMIGLNPRFRPGGSSILVRSAGGGGIRLVDLQTGQESRTLLTDRNFGDVEWDSDGRHVYFIDFDRGIERLDMETGADEILYRSSPQHPVSRGIAVSPDGRVIAFTVVRRGPEPAVTIMVMDRDGRNARPLWSQPQTRPLLSRPVLAATPLLLGEWTADGGMLLFARTETLPSGFVRAETDLWGIASTGGPPIRLGLSAPGLRDVRPHRDGRRVAYAYNDERLELWLLRDALHATVVR